MFRNCPLCTICSSEVATRACLCFREVKLIGNNCLSSHLTSKVTCHYFIEVSIAFELLSNTLHLESFLSKEFSNFLSKNIYISKYSDGLITKYNIVNQTIKNIPISNKRDYAKNATLSISSTGDIFLSSKEVAPKILLYKLRSSRYIDLVRYPDGSVILYSFYFCQYLYTIRAPSQFSSNFILERFNLNTNKSEVLPKLAQFYIDMCPLFIQDKIYFVSGSQSVVQVLNKTTGKLNTISFHNSETRRFRVIAAVIDYKIHLITRDYTQIYDLNFRKLQEINNTYLLSYPQFCRYNVVTHDSVIYFYDEWIGYLKYDTISYKSPEKPRTLAHYAKNRNRYIYYPIEYSKRCMIFDVKIKTVRILDLSRTLKDRFVNFKLCILPTGFIFLLNNYSCYIINPSNFESQSLPTLPIRADNMNIVYCNNHMYVFGHGYGKGSACKLSLSTNLWSSASNMMSVRKNKTCIGLGNLLYIICGDDNAIQVYNTETNSYILYDMEIRNACTVVGERNERIIIIYGRKYKILSKEMQVIEEGEEEGHFDNTNAEGNVVVWGETVYFYNGVMRCVEFLNLKSRRRGVECFKV
jgi:hypothetical protein